MTDPRALRSLAPVLTGAALAGASLFVPFDQVRAQREVVQPLPPAAASELSRALRRLAGNPRDVDALILAGDASLELNDIDAAIGFFGRAEELAPADPRVKSGKAAAFVRSRRPVEALRLFAEAERAGVRPTAVAADKGLALDLVGNNREAQESYRRSLSYEEDGEVRRRLALSHAISGDREAFEGALLPLLEQRDFAAYRSRAFGLAILGETEEAVSIAEAVMPPEMAQRVEPYLRYMRRLTPAQQAAAANLGVFPRAAAIGRDDPAIAAARVASGTPALAGVDQGLAPSGRPLGGVASAPDSAQTADDSASDGRLTREQRRALRQQRRQAGRLSTRGERQVRVAQAQAADTASPPQPAAIQASPSAPGPASAAPRTQPAEFPAERPVERGELPALAQASSSSAAFVPSSTAVAQVPESANPAPVASSSDPAPSPALASAPPVSSEFPAAAPQASPTDASPPPATIASVEIEPSRVAGAPAELPATPAVEPSSAPVTVATLGTASPAPGFDLGRVNLPEQSDSPASAATPQEGPPVAAPPASLFPEPEPAPRPAASVSEAFADFLGTPAAQPAARPNAVDITAIEIPREVEEEQEAAPPPQPASPSRIWVQVATGRDRSALRFDWRRFARRAPEVLSDNGPFVATWGETNRLLAGPYESRTAANAAVTALAEEGIGAFRFTSADGEEIETLD